MTSADDNQGWRGLEALDEDVKMFGLLGAFDGIRARRSLTLPDGALGINYYQRIQLLTAK